MRFFLTSFFFLVLFYSQAIAADWVRNYGPVGPFVRVCINDDRDLLFKTGCDYWFYSMKENEVLNTYERCAGFNDYFQHSDGHVYCIGPNHLMISSDGGRSWRDRAAPPGITLKSASQGPDGSILITSYQGLFKTDAEFEEWEKIHTLITGAPPVKFDSKGILYACGRKQIALSTNKGSYWSFIDTDETISDFTVTDKGIYAVFESGSFRFSNDYADSWIELDSLPGLLRKMVVLPQGEIIVLCFGGIIHQYDQENDKWFVMSQGLGENLISWLYSNRAGDLVACDNNCSIYKYDFILNSWQILINSLPDINISKLAGGRSNSLFASTSVKEKYNDYAIFESQNGGKTWTRFYNDALRNKRDDLYDFLEGPDGYFYISNGKYIFRKKEQSLDTVFVIPKNINDFVRFKIVFGPDGKVFLWDDRYIFSSTDNGENWVEHMSDSYNKPCLAGYSSEGKLFATINGAMHISEDLGEYWKPYMPFEEFSDIILARFVGEDEIFVGTSNGNKIFYSYDGGNRWELLGNDLFTNTFCINSTGIIFTDKMISTDKGQTWQNIELPIGFKDFVPVGAGNVYAMTSSGIYQYNGEITSAGRSYDPPGDMLRISPMPVDEHVRITLNLEKRSDIRLRLIDCRGALSLELARGTYAAGMNEFCLATEEFGPGLFFIQLLYKGNIYLKKIVILR